MSLDEQDNDLPQLLFGFLAAVQSIFPETGREAKAMLSAPNLPPLEVLSTGLINDLDRIEQDFMDEAVAASLTEKAEGWITGLRLAVISLRHQPDEGAKMLEMAANNHHPGRCPGLICNALSGLDQ